MAPITDNENNERFAKALGLSFSPLELFVMTRAGKISETEALEFQPHRLLNGSSNLSSKKCWTVELCYYLGEYAKENGDIEDARSLLGMAVVTEMRHSPEWHLANHALETLKVQ